MILAALVALLSFPLGPLGSVTACEGPRTPGELRNKLWAGADSKYDKHTRPAVAKLAANAFADPAQAEPDVAKVQLHVNALTFLYQKRNEYQINVWFRQRWKDHRLAYNSSRDGGCFPDDQREGFREELLSEIWHPDFFIENQVKVDSHISGSFWILPEGDVVYVKAEMLTVSCNMDFTKFPKDVQTCNFRVGTFLEDATDVVLEFWDGIDPITLASDNYDPGDLSTTAHGGTSDFKIINVTGFRPEADTGLGATQSESYVYYSFQLERESDYYKDFVIMPSILMVFIGWSSFFINRAAAPARVTMSMICFLTNTNYLSAQLASLPRLGNDVWLLKFLTVSQIFTFYAVIEYVLCNYLMRVESRITGGKKRALEIKTNKLAMERQKKRQLSQSITTDIEDGIDSGSSEEEPKIKVTKQEIMASGFKFKLDTCLINKNGRMIVRDQHVDVFSRYAYPVVYIISCLFIWSD